MRRISPDMATSPRPILPGEDAVEPALLDEAVAEVNRLYTAKGLETARIIGEYVLRRFFAGDVEAFRSRGRHHLSFEALRARADLRVSSSFLWYSVSVLEQLRMLPPDIATALPMSHHRLLLHVRNPADKLGLARDAVAESLSKRALEQRVRELRRSQPYGPRVGRPALPAFVKAFNRLKQVRDQASSERVTATDLRHLSEEKLARLLEDAEDALSALEETMDAVREAVDEKRAERERKRTAGKSRAAAPPAREVPPDDPDPE